LLFSSVDLLLHGPHQEWQAYCSSAVGLPGRFG
jgi:hypothetical protein